MRLKNKIAIVTGGGSGFGAGIVKKFIQEGAKVVVADINLENAKKVAMDTGGFAVEVDVSNSLSFKNLVDKTLEKFKLRISKDKKNLEYDYSPNKKKTGITTLLNEIKKTGIELTDVQTKQSNLEQIFVEILKND